MPIVRLHKVQSDALNKEMPRSSAFPSADELSKIVQDFQKLLAAEYDRGRKVGAARMVRVLALGVDRRPDIDPK